MPGLVPRQAHTAAITARLKASPVVLLIGARQVGKSTLARQVMAGWRGATELFDLEDMRDRRRLSEPELVLQRLRGLVVIDEIQHHPDLFPLLRVLADRPRTPARFLLLGSAAPELLRQGSESLAGRVSYYELSGLDLEEVGPTRLDRLWLRGGLPRSYVARSHEESSRWRRDFVRSFLERDLPQLGITVAAATLRSFWTMIAHYHAQTWNGSELGRALGVSHVTARRYLDVLCSAFVARQLQPWAENVGKRVVKSPKAYIRDSGLLHTLLEIGTRRDLDAHPKVGASWEGCLLELVIRRLRARDEQCFFWGTHADAELDLLVVHGRRRYGFELKRTSAPAMTRSMHSAMETLELTRLDVVHAGAESYPLGKNVRAVSAYRLLDELAPL